MEVGPEYIEFVRIRKDRSVEDAKAITIALSKKVGNLGDFQLLAYSQSDCRISRNGQFELPPNYPCPELFRNTNKQLKMEESMLGFHLIIRGA